MAKKEKLNYSQEERLLREKGPKRLYLLYGEEDYLREIYLKALKKACLDGAEEDFNYRRLNGEEVSMSDISGAVDAMPFFAERTLVEIRNFSINHCRESDAEELKKILGDIPGYCTIAFVQYPGNEPDGRLALTKLIKKLGHAIDFTGQDESALAGWIAKRLAAGGKRISRADAEYLIFTGGTLMNRLIPEMDKLISGSAGETVTKAEIDKMVRRIPEAEVFEMTDLLGMGKFDEAAARLGDTLAANEAPIKVLALIGMQMRRIFAVKVAMESRLSHAEALELSGAKYDFLLQKLQGCAKRYSIPQLRDIVDMCAEYDYRMKSTGLDGKEILREFFGAMAARVKC